MVEGFGDNLIEGSEGEMKKTGGRLHGDEHEPNNIMLWLQCLETG